jgi:ABC-2 type transport system ATP-binding protein
MQVQVRCTHPAVLSARLFEQNLVVEARLHADGDGVLIKTRDAERFYRALNHIVLDGIEVESIAPADDNVNSLYEYLIGGEEPAR